jgi:hypothetical protein
MWAAPPTSLTETPIIQLGYVACDSAAHFKVGGGTNKPDPSQLYYILHRRCALRPNLLCISNKIFHVLIEFKLHATDSRPTRRELLCYAYKVLGWQLYAKMGGERICLSKAGRPPETPLSAAAILHSLAVPAAQAPLSVLQVLPQLIHPEN